MNDFKRGGRSGGGNRFGGNRGFNRRGSGRDFGRGDNERKEMFPAVCDNCGKKCEVPFRPSGDKPIFCSECFEKKNQDNPRRSDDRGRGRFGGGSNDNSKQVLDQLSSLNAKMDKLLGLLEGNKVEVKDEQEEVTEPVVKKTRKSSKPKKVEEPSVEPEPEVEVSPEA